MIRMRWVVFLRAVNVGGTNRCQPAQIAKELAKFGLVNVGAVGTFVVREDVTESTLRAAIAKKLSFKCEIMICTAKQIVDLARENPFDGDRGNDIDAHVSIMAKPPAKVPALPIYVPSKDNWEIKIARAIGPAVLSLRRKVPNGHLYPNQIVEKQFGVAATTRSWNTIGRIAKILEENR
jgi:uncharacterized protein (DUF1697 family)